ncbi:hypothetical protein TSUD_340050 [Trifolium subterraneum]|nr:hypothetical protein TSUD_340050 [Trifolium subterraneum]
MSSSIHQHSSSSSRSTASVLTLLKACKRIQHLQQIHASIIQRGLEQDQFLVSNFISLANTFSTSALSYSTAVFNRVLNPSTFLWNTLIRTHCQSSLFSDTISAFVHMKAEGGIPDNYTYPSVIKACSGTCKVGDLSSARGVFDSMPEKNVVSFTTMIDGYAKAGDMAASRSLFEQAAKKDIVAWSALISGYVQNGQPNQALEVFLEMESMNVKPDEFILVALMSAASQLVLFKLVSLVKDLNRYPVSVFSATGAQIYIASVTPGSSPIGQ